MKVKILWEDEKKINHVKNVVVHQAWMGLTKRFYKK